MTMIKRAHTAKIGDDLLEDPNIKPQDLFDKKLFRRGSVYDRGMLLRPFDPKTGLKMGYDNDDFIHNRITVMVEQRAYPKVPRILQAVYQVEKYKPKRSHISVRRRWKFPIKKKIKLSALA